MRDKIVSFPKSNIWKIWLAIAVSFISSKDVDEEHVMHLKGDNIWFMPYDNVNKVVNELLESFLSRYQMGLETSMIRSDSIFDSVQLMYYKCHKIIFSSFGSYIDSPEWIKKKKITIDLKNKDDKCF